MRLSQFIVANNERILAEFESFARSINLAGSMDIAALRDHAAGMLTVIVRDLESPQTKREGSDKARGQSDSSEDTPDTPAQEHGAGRATSGFTFVEMVSEYRSLRASVIRCGTPVLFGSPAMALTTRRLTASSASLSITDSALATPGSPVERTY